MQKGKEAVIEKQAPAPVEDRSRTTAEIDKEAERLETLRQDDKKKELLKEADARERKADVEVKPIPDAKVVSAPLVEAPAAAEPAVQGRFGASVYERA